eukprot:SAG31_NODE_288_length_18400_cov_55.018851_3_plen_101_part_00
MPLASQSISYRWIPWLDDCVRPLIRATSTLIYARQATVGALISELEHTHPDVVQTMLSNGEQLFKLKYEDLFTEDKKLMEPAWGTVVPWTPTKVSTYVVL